MEQDKLFCESAVLGAMLIDENAARGATHFLKAPYFFTYKHQLIFKSCCAALAKNNAIDLILVVQESKDNGSLAEIGGEVYLSKLMTAVTTPEHWKYYAVQIKRAYHESRQYKAAEAFKRVGDADKLIKDIAEEQRQILLADDRKSLSLLDVGVKAIRQIECPQNQLKIGYDFIDENSPVERGDLIIIAGRPQCGKSLLNINITKRTLEKGSKVLIFTTEMTPEHFFKRQIALHTGVPYFIIKKRKFNLGQVGEINGFVSKFTEENNNKLFYSSISRPSIQDIASEIERAKADLVIIDNLSGCKLGRALQNKTDNIGAFVWELKDLLIQNDCTGVLTCHLSRASERGRKDEDEPLLSDIKDSSSLEEAGTHVILLWEGRKEKSSDFLTPKEIRYRVAKDRDGSGGTGKIILNRQNLEMTED